MNSAQEPMPGDDNLVSPLTPASFIGDSTLVRLVLRGEVCACRNRVHPRNPCSWPAARVGITTSARLE